MVYNRVKINFSPASLGLKLFQSRPNIADFTQSGEWKGYSNMDCKEEEKLIPAFLQDELDSKAMEEFIKHIENCPECNEELSIQFLVSEGLERLEAGNNFNLQNALLMRLEDARHQVKVRHGLQYTLLCLEVAVGVAILIALIIAFRLS